MSEYFGKLVADQRSLLATRISRDLEDNGIDPSLVIPDGLDDQL